MNQKGNMLASSSKDETIIIWNLDKIKMNNQKDSMISILKEHEHVIDCVKWAPYDACVTIDLADYKKDSVAAGNRG